MSVTSDRAPVFVVGAPRSGGRILALALGQHPAFEPLVGVRWLGRLAGALGPVCAEVLKASRDPRSTRVERGVDGFLATFGRTAGALLEAGFGRPDHGWRGDELLRWVDGDPANSFRIFGLSRLFPRARFIHVIRGVEPVVKHLSASSTVDTFHCTPELAHEVWTAHVRACLEGEEALGSGRMLRLRYRDLASDPEVEMRACLDFLGEAFHPASLRPFRGLRPDPRPRRPEGGSGGRSRVQAGAEALSRRILSGEREPAAASVRAGDGERGEELAALARAFLAGEWEGGRFVGGGPLHRLPVGPSGEGNEHG
jgi:hypothetical protein